MSDETAFLAAIKSNPKDDTVRLVYADWLDEQSDPRSSFVRLHLALRSVAPDHVQRPAGERELSVLRKGLAPEWLRVIEPERAHLYDTPPTASYCGCFQGLRHGEDGGDGSQPSDVEFHVEPQDTECDGWKRLCALVEQAAEDAREEFAPRRELSDEDWLQIVTLPPTIAKLKKVKRLHLYHSYLTHIPAEIGEMADLEEFTPYTSYRLHWFPYEITRCKLLRDSTVSTRAIYGNFKNRPPFPLLEPGMFAGRPEPSVLPLKDNPDSPLRKCSVCNQPFVDRREHRVWISLRVATDNLPLLVNACSEECIKQLPVPPKHCVRVSHRGGPTLVQPAPYW